MIRIYFLYPIALLILIILLFRVCSQEEVLSLDLKVSPQSGVEPLVVDLMLTAESNQKIKSVRIDFDGDRNYDFEYTPSSKTYSLHLTNTYMVPQEHRSDEEFSFQIYTRVEGKKKISEKTQIVRVFPKKDFEFYVVANVCSGPPPLEVSFQIFPTSCEPCIFSMDCDGDGKYEFSQQSTHFTCNFLNEGIYPSKVSVSDGKGNFSVSTYFFCGFVSQSRISRFIEVLSKLSLKSVIYPPRAFKILDVFYDSGITEYIALSSPKSIMVLKNRKIVDVFGYDIIYSTPSFAKFFGKDGRIFMYFSSEYGTFKWVDGVTEKISDRRIITLYPNESSYFVLDHIRQTYGFCSDEKIENCQEFPFDLINFYSEPRIYDDHLLISNSLDNNLILTRLGNFPNYLEIISRYTIHAYDYFSPSLILLIPRPISDEFFVLKLDDLSEIRYETPDQIRIKFNSGAFLDEENIILGTPNFPCEIGSEIKVCNKLIFNLQSKQFEKIEGMGETIHTLRRGRNVFLLHDQGLDVISKILLNSYKVSTHRLPGSFEVFLYDGKRLYITSQKIISFFDLDQSKTRFSGYIEIPDGIPSVVQKSDNLLFIGISDDLSTNENEGSLVIVDLNENRISKVVRGEISLPMCAYVRGDKLFICDRDKVVVFATSGQKIKEIVFPEYIKDLYFTDDNILYAVSDRHLFTLSFGGSVFDIKETVMQFFKLDVDEKRKLLFTAEGQDHNFRIFDISSIAPQELTRVSIDYGTYNDIAVGVTHFENLVFVSSSYTGLMVFDVSDPQKPLIRKKTYFDDFSAPVENCFVDRFSAVCSSVGSILFIK